MPIIFFLLFFFLTTHPFVIMIDPAGDARHTGRIIGDSLERALTLQIAQALQKKLAPRCSVIITRSPGEIVYPLQNANFANRLAVDLYLSLSCYSAPKEPLLIDLYQLSFGDMPLLASDSLRMIPYDKAHHEKSTQSKNLAHAIQTSLSSFCSVRGIHALPFFPLIGIQSPAIGIEFNVPHETAYEQYIDPLADAITHAIYHDA